MKWESILILDKGGRNANDTDGDDSDGDDDNDDDRNSDSDDSSGGNSKGLGRSSDNDTNSSSKWFDEPFKFRNFSEYFPDMLTEDALEEAVESLKTFDHESNDESDEEEDSSELILPTTRNAISAALDEIHENEQKPEKQNHSNQIYIPHLKDYRYKSTVVTELRNNPHLSSDRLQRIKSAKQSSISTEEPYSMENTVGLFDDICFYENGNSLKFGHVIRIRKKKPTSGYVEYIRPVSLANPDEFVYLTLQLYVPELCNGRFKLSEERQCLPVKDVFRTVLFDFESEIYILSDKDLLEQNPNISHNQNIDDEGRIVETHVTRSGRIRNVIRYAFK